jgi:hypothetical protein
MARFSAQLLTNAIAGVTSSAVRNAASNGVSVQGLITGTSGAVQANISIMASHTASYNPDTGALVGSNGKAIATVVLGDGVLTSDNQLAFIAADYPYVWAVLNTISGTGASVNLYVGV